MDERKKVEDLAKDVGWSRWQLQRQFSSHINKDVAQYIRALKLSSAAEQLVTTTFRIVDIAHNYGFDIEANFTRAFKQHFGCTPKEYRQAHALHNIIKPTESLNFIAEACDGSNEFVDISIHTQPETVLYGVHTKIDNLLTGDANIQTQIPQCWNTLRRLLHQSNHIGLDTISPNIVGVWDIKHAYEHKGTAKYWACIHPNTPPTGQLLERIVIPEQSYVFIKLKCNVTHLIKAVEWLVHIWLPNSDYSHITAYDLELYDLNQQNLENPIDMTYAIPVSLKNAPKR